MARKSEGTPRKSTSSRKTTAKKAAPVTPIREDNVGVVENGTSQAPATGQMTTQLNQEIQEEIRFRAYELYLERGGQDGFDQEDWRRAEEEILSKYQREKSA